MRVVFDLEETVVRELVPVARVARGVDEGVDGVERIRIEGRASDVVVDEVDGDDVPDSVFIH